MEVLRRHARSRPIIRDAVLPANQQLLVTGPASQGVARVVFDVSVLCPCRVARIGNACPSATQANGRERSTAAAEPARPPGGGLFSVRRAEAPERCEQR